MDRWERTRIGAAIVVAVAAVPIIGWFSNLVLPSDYPARAVYNAPDLAGPTFDLAAVQRSWPQGMDEPGEYTRLRGYMGNIRNAVVPVSATSEVAAVAPAPEVDLGTRLAASDKAKGAQTAKVCMACHNFIQGGPNGVGPNLWGIVGRPVASHAGYAYSAAMQAEKGPWTYERLDKYLTSPARAIPGNKMGFAGIRNAQDRANVIAFLGSLSARPMPFPHPQSH